MARTEAQIAADISTTNAKINSLIGGIGVQGDYADGDIRVNRSALLDSLRRRIDALEKELDLVPSLSIGTADIAVDGIGQDSSEYVGDEYYG